MNTAKRAAEIYADLTPSQRECLDVAVEEVQADLEVVVADETTDEMRDLFVSTNRHGDDCCRSAVEAYVALLDRALEDVTQVTGPALEDVARG